MNFFTRTQATLIIGVLLVAGLSFAIYKQNNENTALQSTVADLQTTLATTEKNLEEVAQNARKLLEALETEQQKTAFLKEQSETFGIAVQRLTGTVSTLEKLQKTDPELLIKYSKVYFLNEHYTPEKLTLLPKEDIQNVDEEYFHGRALPYLSNLLTEAKNAGVELKIISAFRSFETQRDLKSQYKVTYGSGANKFSAEQGYSEHQLGTTIDFTTPVLGPSFSSFDSTTSFTWLQENAHRFGFILSYPKNNAYYIYEPWHWRFVGIELATKLKNDGKNFYDMDQREINEYLVKIFD